MGGLLSWAEEEEDMMATLSLARRVSLLQASLAHQLDCEHSACGWQYVHVNVEPNVEAAVKNLVEVAIPSTPTVEEAAWSWAELKEVDVKSPLAVPVAEEGSNYALHFSRLTAFGRLHHLSSQTSEGEVDVDVVNSEAEEKKKPSRSSKTLYVADTDNHALRAISLADFSVSTVNTSDLITRPFALVADPARKSLLVVEYAGQCVKRVKRSGAVSTVKKLASFEPVYLCGATLMKRTLFMTAAHGILRVALKRSLLRRKVTQFVEVEPFVEGEDLDEHHISSAASLSSDSDGNLFVADCLDNCIRIVTPGGSVYTLAGSGNHGHNDGRAMEACFSFPYGCAVDKQRNILLVTDRGNHTVRWIEIRYGTVNTLAGSPGQQGHVDGDGFSAQFDTPCGIVIDEETGNAFVSCANNTIRCVTPRGHVTTVGGQPGRRGLQDGVHSLFSRPSGLAIL